MLLALEIVSAAGAAVAQVALKDLDATRRRPLFVPTRRPPQPPAPLAAPPPKLPAPPELPPMHLSGVVIGPDRTFAVVKRDRDAKLFSLDVGRELEGWSVEAIRPREIDVRKGGQAATLHLPTR